MDDNPIKCFFTESLHLAFRSYVDKKKMGNIGFIIQQPDNVTNAKIILPVQKTSFQNIRKYTSIEGIIYSIENNKIISLQDNFEYLGDVLFTVYFDFETTTSDDIFQDRKMFAINYCQINVFHLALNLDKIVIFRSFQQSAEEIFDLNHFRQGHVAFFFDKVTFNQLKDGVTTVLACKKSTSLSQLFSIELKFTIDTPTSWFKHTIKPKFVELEEIMKQIFVRENL